MSVASAPTTSDGHFRRGRLSGGWAPIVGYGLVAAATQALWLTYAPITTEAAHHYGVSEAAIGWLSEIFPLLYVLLAIPAGILLDRWFRPVLASGGVLVACGGLLRLGGDSFAWALAGQAVVSIAQPVVMSAVSKLAGEYLRSEQRSAGIAAGSAAGFLGMLIALLLGPAIGANHLKLLLAIEAAAAILAALCMALTLLRGGSERSQERVAVQRNVVGELWRQPSIKLLCWLSFIGFGAFVAIATWLQTLLHPSGISETAAGALLVGMVVAGVVGCALLPPLIERRHVERGFIRCVVVAGCLGSIGLGVLPGIPARAVVMVVMGFLVLPALPVILTLAERIAGPAAGTAGAIVWLAGNLGGLIVALIVQALVHEPLAAFIALAAVIALALPFAGRTAEVARLAEAMISSADRRPADGR
ncbi:MAG TPA: MFS transporter [Solirubrobacteraceae bacterium]|jgi:predicted MFS family arabinose efflux permease